MNKQYIPVFILFTLTFSLPSIEKIPTAPGCVFLRHIAFTRKNRLYLTTQYLDVNISAFPNVERI